MTEALARALLVGDSATLEAVVHDFPDDDPLAVSTATTRAAALEAIDADERLECIVSAYDLPNTDGVSLLSTVRERRPDLPVVLYVDDGSEEIASEAISVGVTEYVPTALAAEPPDVLATRIENAVTHHRTETELAERERQLTTLIGNLPGIVYRCRPKSDWAMTLLRGDCEPLVGYDPARIVDGPVSWGEDIVHPDDRADALESLRQQLERGDRFRVTYRIRTANGTRKWVEERGAAVYATGDGGTTGERPSPSTHDNHGDGVAGRPDDELVALEGFIMDITERKRRKQELERYETVLETIPDGAYVLDENDRFQLVNDALVSMTGWDRSELLRTHISTIDESMGTVEQLRSGLAAGNRDVATMDTRIRRSDGETFPAEVRFTTLSPDDGDATEFGGDDRAAADEFSGIAGVIRDASERKARKRQLEHQREQLAAITQLYRVQADITRSVIELSARSEIEQRVCDRLAETDSYRFAWIGGIDRGSKTIEPRAAAGVEKGYLDSITITVGESETGQGPTGEAVRTGELQVQTDVLTDPDYEPWRAAATERGYRSSAAVPIAYGDSSYGVLNVYTAREDAFDGYEREILEGLGEIIGHAISARQREKTLMSDVVREVEFRATAIESPLIEASAGRDCTIDIERLVPADGDAFIHFLSVEGIDPEAFETAISAIDAVTDVSAITPTDDGSLFEVTIRDPPLTGLFAERGGRLRSVRIDDGELHCTAELPPDVDVRGVIDTVAETDSTLEVLAQRTRRAEDRTAEEFRTRVLDSLTEKQQQVLETAYSAGFFDWPREQSGEDVAETLDISPATFSQHLRTAQRKVMETLLAEGTDADH
ncbi:bacterio-opsin activator domain-containing protein [Natrinema altunense]|uniref:PAS domain S-box protein n=1 Tax=Natrinema altunense TaxID=222984 RepID=A0A482XVX8_9EURY|nr:bacterio-opsin activator domain-containing protein [Natrinema altunense]RZH67709.1 PAS domain S-box protein [Natrinema altunense]